MIRTVSILLAATVAVSACHAPGSRTDGGGGAAIARCFFRNGLICLAMLSHNACSSSLSIRLRRGGSRIGGGRFMRIDDDGQSGEDGGLCARS